MKILLIPLLILSLVSATTLANPMSGFLAHGNLANSEKAGLELLPGKTGNSIILNLPATDRSVHFLTIPVPDSARDWRRVGTFTFEMESTSTLRFSIRLVNSSGKKFSYVVHPFIGMPVRVAISGDSLRYDFTNNSQFKGYWLSNWGNHIDLSEIVAIEINSRPNKDVTIELGDFAIHAGVVEDAILAEGPFVDVFGQWIAADWPGKVTSLADMQQRWAEEDADLQVSRDYGYSSHGGLQSIRLNATGYFRVAEIDGRWWLIDPEGYLFYSVGMDCVRYQSATKVAGREQIFDKLPAGAGETVNFYEVNSVHRYGKKDFVKNWKAKQDQRLRSWGFNTVANWSDKSIWQDPELPFVINLSFNRGGRNWHRFPDVFSSDFEDRIAKEAAEQCSPYRNEPLLIGYFTGNEERWPHRNFIDLILNDPEPSATQAYIEAFFEIHNDTQASRKQLTEDLARAYFQKVVDAIRSVDPNHLVLGIRWAGGNAPDEVIKANDAFDVYSINFYNFKPSEERIQHAHELTGLPVMIGEFHFGTPDRGYGPSLVSVKDQTERGVAYQYYVEQAAALPVVIGAHYFQHLEQPVTGRFDGENYGFGFITQQDIPHPEMIQYARDTHSRIYQIHLGQKPPTGQQAKVR